MDPGYGAPMGSGAVVPHPPGPMVPNSMMPPGYTIPGPVPHGMGSHMPGMSSGGTYPGMVSSHPQKPPSVLSTVQMKFLSAQIKAYRLLARNAVLPEQLRAFILSHASAVAATASPSSNGTPPPTSSSTSPAPGQGSSLPASSMASSVSSSSTLSPAPGQQQGMSSLATDSQKTSSLSTSTESGQTPAQPAAGAAAASKTEESKGDRGGSGTQPSSTPAKAQAQIRQAKLAPGSKPRGLDPEIILKEREARYSALHVHVKHACTCDNHVISNASHTTVT